MITDLLIPQGVSCSGVHFELNLSEVYFGLALSIVISDSVVSLCVSDEILSKHVDVAWSGPRIQERPVEV